MNMNQQVLTFVNRPIFVDVICQAIKINNDVSWEISDLNCLLGVLVDGCAVLTTNADNVLETLMVVVVSSPVQLGQHYHQVDADECRPHV